MQRDTTFVFESGRMRRLACVTALAALGAMWSARATAPVAAAGEVFVNTTEDLPFESSHCLPSKPCPFRSAIAKAEGRNGTVRACYDPAEVGGTKKCPPGWQPLRVSDPGYDPARKKWIFRIADGFPPIEMATDGNTLDFTRDIDGWSGPQDDRIVLDSGNNEDLKQAINVSQGSSNVFKGFEISGTYVLAGFDFTDAASDNQIGPGMIVSGIRHGIGIRIANRGSDRNHVVGSWCGITGDGSVVSTVNDDCIQILDNAHDTVIGGPNPEDRNVLSGSKLGVGVAVNGAALGTTVQGNWLGLDAAGHALHSNLGGVTVNQGSNNTRVSNNVISGNKGPGVSVADSTKDVTLSDNKIGTDVDGTGRLGNADYGVTVVGLPKGTQIARNRIAYNVLGGLLVSGANTSDNTFSENSITDNNGNPIDVKQGANRNIRPPQVTYVTATEVRGLTCKGCLVEVFSDPSVEADVFEGRVTAGTDGIFTLDKSAGFTYRNLTVTVTDGKNTSALSAPAVVPGPGTPTPAGGATPTATPTRDPTALTAIDLPWLGQGASLR
jgi:parallel beta-helix repeat protein